VVVMRCQPLRRAL
ncbi:hypothetical protein VC95412_003492B, partial [Vibrio cholerae O1 str. 95412]